jgi:hypothetical protein
VTIQELFQPRSPQDHAIDHYVARYEWFAETQQMYADIPDVAVSVGQAAFLFRTAIDAELMDPEPANPRPCTCVDCRLYRMGLR